MVSDFRCKSFKILGGLHNACLYAHLTSLQYGTQNKHNFAKVFPLNPNFQQNRLDFNLCSLLTWESWVPEVTHIISNSLHKNKIAKIMCKYVVNCFQRVSFEILWKSAKLFLHTKCWVVGKVCKKTAKKGKKRWVVLRWRPEGRRGRWWFFDIIYIRIYHHARCLYKAMAPLFNF